MKPVDNYYTGEQLMPLGCLVFHECLLREIGVKSYWFDKKG